jgi:hypothetical protein
MDPPGNEVYKKLIDSYKNYSKKYLMTEDEEDFIEKLEEKRKNNDIPISNSTNDTFQNNSD